jgi:hypothetical protein
VELPNLAAFENLDLGLDGHPTDRMGRLGRPRRDDRSGRHIDREHRPGHQARRRRRQDRWLRLAALLLTSGRDPAVDEPTIRMRPRQV